MKLSDILSDESKWTKGAMARLEDETPIACISDRAEKFCLAGALCRLAVLKKLPFSSFYAELEERFSGPISIWNDAPRRTWEEVAEVVSIVDQWIEEREGI